MYIYIIKIKKDSDVKLGPPWPARVKKYGGK